MAIGSQLPLKKELVFSSKYTVAGLEAVLLLILVLSPIGATIKRPFAIYLIGLITLDNLVSLGNVTVIASRFGNGGFGSQPGRQHPWLSGLCYNKQALTI